MDRQTAYSLVSEKIKQDNLIKHIISVEAVMRRLATHFGEDSDRWGMVGLLHDLDYADTVDQPERHTYLTREWLAAFPEIDADMIHAIQAHAEHVECQSKMDWAIYATDPTTGLITAAVLMHPSKQLAQLEVKSIIKRFKDKRFAVGARRDAISKCDQLGLTLEEFLALALDGMRSIANELGF
jgi:uncharacterized protein